MEDTEDMEDTKKKEVQNKRIFSPGDVIWVDGEYRMSSAQESDLSVLIIHVPNKRKDKTTHHGDFFGISSSSSISSMSCNGSQEEEEMMAILQNQRGRWLWLEIGHHRKTHLQKIVLTLLGVGLSSLMTFFWIKVAPLQLAVGIGGLCMVGGGTLGIVTLGEMICDEIVEYIDKRRQERILLGEEEEEVVVGGEGIEDVDDFDNQDKTGS